MMNRRTNRRTLLEKIVWKALSRGWKSAKEVSEGVGIPWRVCARTLKRMAVRGDIEISERETTDWKYRIRKRPIYRVCATMRPVGPDWFVQAAGFSIEVKEEEVV
jgi:hypothetical protein